MDDQILSRRQMVKGAGALSAAGALVALHGTAAAHPETTHAGTKSVEGSWLIASKPDGDRLLYSFLPGGVLVGTRAGSTVITANHPSATGTLHGAWVRTGGRTFSATTHELRTDSQRQFVGSATVTVDITLAKHLDAFSATWHFNFVNPDGSVGGSGSGTIRGTRITVKKP